MKKILILGVFATLSITCFGQINFEKGYFIDNQNQKIDCFIKNSDWVVNPDFFIYKLTENEVSKKGTINDVKEFSIPNSFKFIRAEIDIDTSSSHVGNISSVIQPLWKHTQLFLKVLVEGKANLYYFGGDYERFFYSCKDSAIKQLIYKEYYYENGQIAYNKGFQQQLNREVCCSPFTAASIQDLSYSADDLEEYFLSYNACVDPSSEIKKVTRKKGKFTIAFSPGIAFSSLSVSNNFTSYADTKFENKISPLFNFNIEYVLPFHKNKWSLMVTPSYQAYKTQSESNYGSLLVEFSSIEVAVGIKHYFYLNDHIKLFIDGSYNPAGFYTKGSKLGWKSIQDGNFSYMNIKGYSPNFIFGGGFEYKNLYAEIKYFTNQNILSSYPFWDSDLEKVSLSIGYKFLKTKVSQ